VPSGAPVSVKATRAEGSVPWGGPGHRLHWPVVLMESACEPHRSAPRRVETDGIAAPTHSSGGGHVERSQRVRASGPTVGRPRSELGGDQVEGRRAVLDCDRGAPDVRRIMLAEDQASSPQLDRI